MSKHRRNPFTNSYYCKKTPHKMRYLKAAFAWKVGARQVKKTGEQLYLYRCEACDGWHLTKRPGPNAVKIETKSAPGPSEDKGKAA